MQMMMTSPAIARTDTSRVVRPAIQRPHLDLLDGDVRVGWIDGRAIGFRGFGSDVEAAHAAWVAYRTMARRFARELGQRPPPIDIEPISIRRSGAVEHIVASGRSFGRLIRPGTGSRSGADSFGFELQVPVPAAELTMRSTAYLLYRTMRRAGIRWALWRPGQVGAAARAHSKELRLAS